jgi:nucleoid-associated protein YgaU
LRAACPIARAVVAAAAIASLTTVAGCGKPVLRVADASLGDYYTDKEYRNLTEEQREEYCRELANQRDLFLEQIASAEEALQTHRLQTEPRRREVDSLRAEAAELESRLATLAGGGPPPREDGTEQDKGSRAYVVRRGDSLWRIASRADVYGRGVRWKRLYEANQDRIGNPDRIHPGQEIQIPR